MKAILIEEYGDEEVLLYREVPQPAVGNGDVLVRIEAAGVNPVDTYVRAGNHISAPEVPFIPGKDGAGTIVEVGPEVNKEMVGRRVYFVGASTGTYAEYSVANAQAVQEVPGMLSSEKAAGLFVPYATAYRALFTKGELQEGQTVLVHGASGSVGIAAVQFAKANGCRVFGTAGSEAGKSAVLEAGADDVFDHGSKGYLEEIKKASGGIDLIVEMLANVNLVKDFEVIRKFGKIVVVGSRGAIEFEPRLTMTKDVSIRGLSLFNGTPDEFEAIFKSIDDGVRAGILDPLIDEKIELKDAAEAHRKVINKKSSGKIVLIP